MKIHAALLQYLPRLVTAVLLAFVGVHLTDTLRSASASQTCECTCEKFDEMMGMMQKLKESSQSEQSLMMEPEFQQALMCNGQCAMEWSRCAAGAASGSDGDKVGDSTDSGREAASEAADGGSAGPSDEPYPLGEPRDDLERFYGVYGDGQSRRDYFVTEAKSPRDAERKVPPGYLMIGAMWGDVAPWYMKAVSETRFEQQWVNPAAQPLVVEFELDGDGNARAIVLESAFEDRGRLERVGDLPEGW
jgi:hypothetical protein